jgi:hypothetical protein
MGLHGCSGFEIGFIASTCTADPNIRKLCTAKRHLFKLVSALRTLKSQYGHDDLGSD